MTRQRPRIAVFAGATATILSTIPLLTSDKAYAKYGLEPGGAQPPGGLRPQRLAAPVTVYIEQFSAHPLESDAAELYGPPDGYIGADGSFSPTRRSDTDVPAYEVTLEPADGLYLLPYMARQADGSPWQSDGISEGAPPEKSRQGFLPDASRLIEEIDRFEVEESGYEPGLADQADFEFFRVVPSGGYTKGLAKDVRTDEGDGDIEPEQPGRDFFPYRPKRFEPPPAKLAHLTNMVQDVLSSGRFDGGIWLEGSPYVEETAYWFQLLLDIDVPLICTGGNIGPPSKRNVVDAVAYIASGIALDENDRDRVGVVAVIDEMIISARELQKADERPGGFIATGAHGGIVGTIGRPGPPVLTFVPARKHTSASDVRISALPRTVTGWRSADGDPQAMTVEVTDEQGHIRGAAVPRVTIVKHARYRQETDPDAQLPEIDARAQVNLEHFPLAGFVAEGGTPYGQMGSDIDAALRRAALRGMPTVKVSRGNAEGFVPAELAPFAIGGGNLTATKARLLLMACLLRLGALPAAQDPDDPTPDELAAIEAKLREYQRIFDTH
jgi:hypothetical protein